MEDIKAALKKIKALKRKPKPEDLGSGLARNAAEALKKRKAKNHAALKELFPEKEKKGA